MAHRLTTHPSFETTRPPVRLGCQQDYIWVALGLILALGGMTLTGAAYPIMGYAALPFTALGYAAYIACMIRLVRDAYCIFPSPTVSTPPPLTKESKFEPPLLIPKTPMKKKTAPTLAKIFDLDCEGLNNHLHGVAFVKKENKTMLPFLALGKVKPDHITQYHNQEFLNTSLSELAKLRDDERRERLEASIADPDKVIERFNLLCCEIQLPKRLEHLQASYLTVYDLIAPWKTSRLRYHLILDAEIEQLTLAQILDDPDIFWIQLGNYTLGKKSGTTPAITSAEDLQNVKLVDLPNINLETLKPFIQQVPYIVFMFLQEKLASTTSANLGLSQEQEEPFKKLVERMNRV